MTNYSFAKYYLFYSIITTLDGGGEQGRNKQKRYKQTHRSFLLYIDLLCGDMVKCLYASIRGILSEGEGSNEFVNLHNTNPCKQTIDRLY